MGIIKRTAELMWFAKRSDAGATPAGFFPQRVEAVTTKQAVRISNVFRAVQIIDTSVRQLGVKQLRDGRRVELADFIENPEPDKNRSSFFGELVTSLSTDGNAFARVIRDRSGIIGLRALPPEKVNVRENKAGATEYVYGNKVYSPASRDSGDIIHMKFLRFPGVLRGLGPIEAARIELEGVRDARDYAAYWMRDNDSPSGTLTSDQSLSDDTLKKIKNRWRGLDDDGKTRDAEKGPTIRVLSNGFKYEANRIKPADMQFLETQQFNTTQISRLFGVPASLMLATVEGGSQSYANVEQDWISFTRFTLMTYVTEIEESLSRLLPRGERVKLNLDALSRSDTKTRYEGYQIGLAAGFLDVEEVREWENLPAREAADKTDSWVADALHDAVAKILSEGTKEVKA